MSLDLSNLLAQASLRKPRRPVAEEMLSIRVRDVRPLVEVHQQTIRLPQMGGSLSLLWRWRSGGCLGPEAAAAMNARQRQPRESRPAAEPPLDRGATGGWHLDLVCPVCSKPCRKLFAHSWSERIRPDARLWACRLCHRVTYASSNRPGSSKGRRPPSYHYRKHEEAALKIRRDFMRVAPEELHLPNLFLVWKPLDSTIHWERWEALRQLCRAHEILSRVAWSEAIHRLALQVGVEEPTPDHELEINRACALLKENSWATRQSSWHRRGRPRPGPVKGRARPVDPLGSVAAGGGCTVTYGEKVSSTVPSHKRQALQEALGALEQGDSLVVAKLDRLGRTQSEVVARLAELSDRGVYVETLDGLLNRGALGRMAPLVIGLLTGLAEVERSLIQERTRESVEHRRRTGGNVGGRPPLAEGRKDLVRRLRDEGKSYREVAEVCGVSIATAHRYGKG